MPTPPLPLLHALLLSLRIPIYPSTLSTTSPSLLLVVLETLLGARLPLPHPIRLCSTHRDEVAVVKCILGTLADDVLMLDLSVIDPVKVVQGGEQELAVLIMALSVVAKRKGIQIRLPAEDGELDGSGGEDHELDWSRSEEDDSLSLPEPLVPDISYYPTMTPDVSTQFMDVFGGPKAYERHFEKDTVTEDIGRPSHLETPGFSHDGGSARWTKYGTSSTSTSTSGRTVLQQMLDEFGL